MSATIGESGANEPMVIEASGNSQQQTETITRQEGILQRPADSNSMSVSIEQQQISSSSNSQNISNIGSSSQKQDEEQKQPSDNPFEKGRYLDVKDYLGDWRVGIVQSVIEKQMKAHIQFDGCSSKQDDFIHINSNRFLQFRRVTKGYTGEKNSAIRFRRNIDDIQLMISTFVEMEKNEFKGVSAVQYNQHARGKYFFGVDQALQNISYEGTAALQVIQLIQNHIKYVIRYIQKFPSLFNDYQKGCSGNDSQFTEIGVAIAFGYFEVFQLLLGIFGTTDRLVTNQNCFYAKNWRLIKSEKDNIMNDEEDQQFAEVVSSSLLENDQDTEIEEQYIGRTPKELLRGKILQEITPIFINSFWQQGGYTAILQLFNSTVSKLIPLEALFQILKIISITLSKANFNSDSMRNHSEILITQSQIYTAERLKLLTEKEIREYDGNLLRRIREKLQEIIKQHHDSSVVDNLLKNVDVMELNVALKLLTSQYLNRKIQGLNDISEVIAEIKHNQNIYNNQAYNNNNMHNMQGYSDFCSYDQLNDRKINPKEFTEWIITNQIIDHLLGDSLHVEIIRRCHEILRFMCVYQQFPVELIDTIWNSCGADKHEAIVSAIYDMIIQISDQLSKSALERVHEKINSIPLGEVTEQTLHLLKGFSYKAIHRLVPLGEDIGDSKNDEFIEKDGGDNSQDCEQDTQDDTENNKSSENSQYSQYWSHPKTSYRITKNFFCMNYLWRIIQESQISDAIPTPIVEGALSIVRDIFSMPQGYKIVRKYTGICLESIGKGESFYQVYYTLCGIFDNHYASDLLQELLESKTNLPHMIVNETYNFIAKTNKNLQKQNQHLSSSTSVTSSALGTSQDNSSIVPSKPSQQIEQNRISGQFSHDANIHIRLTLLEAILCKTELDGTRIFALSSVDFDLLWEAFILHPNSPQESDIFINWIYRKIITKQTTQTVYYGQQTDISHLFTIDLMKHIFLNVFCENSVLDFTKLSNELFAIFLYLFKKINLKAKAIELISGTQKYKVVKEELLGKDTMWKIFRQAENKQVISSCCDQLSEMYLNHETDWENTSSSEKYLRLLTNLCMELLQEGFEKEESTLIDRSVALLIQFFLKFEGEHIERAYKQLLERQYSQYGMQVITFSFILASDGSKKEIKFNSNTPFGLIRRRVAQEFKLPVSSFRLFCKATKSFVETYEDEESRQLSQNTYVLHMIEGADLENAFHPKNFIIQNNQYFDLLFSVLSVNFCSEECHNNLWELILKLPQNEHIKQSILKVEEPWNEIFKGSFHKKLYCLNILYDIITSNSPQFLEWFSKFISSNGYKYLHEMVADLDVNIIQNALSKKYVLQLLKVITLFFKYFQSKEQLEDTEQGIKLQERCFEKIIQCINRICEYSIERELKDLENCAYEKDTYYTAQNHHFRALQAAQNNNNNNNNPQQQQQLNQSEPKPPEFFSVEKDIIHCVLSIINKNHLNRLMAFFTHPLIESILWKGLAQMDNVLAKQFLCQTLEYLFNICKEKQAVLKYLLPVILDKILPEMIKMSVVDIEKNEKVKVQYEGDRSAFFFKFACNIIQKSDESVEYDFEQSVIRLAQTEMNRPVVEASYSQKDEILIGIMSILKEQLILSKSGDLTNLLQSRFNYLTHLLDSTFQLPVKIQTSSTVSQKPSTNVLRGPKFKSPETRKQSFDLLTTLSANNLANLKIILEYIHPLILSGDWRTSNSKHWEIVPKKNEKSSTGYVGLKNLGCICYMNSLLQQLFMIPSFREDILKCQDIRFDSNQPDDNLLVQLKCMFTSLCHSEKEAYNPKKFCHAFKDYEGNPTNVFEQMDIDEFFNALMDRLETQMKGTPHAEAIKQHFGGVLSNEIISKGCSHSSESEEAFLSLSLQVKNKKDIKQSLEALVQGEMLEGDNAYHCEKCNKKVNALKRTCLKKLPNHLILVLKRFEFNYDSMQKVKINQFCSFPEEIDFSEFSQQGLRKMQNNEEKQLQLSKQSSLQQQSSQQQLQSEVKDEYPESYFKYRLNGIVIHMGIADSGHYYSYIRERGGNNNQEPKWMEFNDNIVKPFDPKEIPNEAFGGEEKWKKQLNMMKNAYMMNAMRQKIRNAYLLFYERIEPYEPNNSSISRSISANQGCSSEMTQTKSSENNENISQSDRQKENQQVLQQSESNNKQDQNREFEEEQEDLKEQEKTRKEDEDKTRLANESSSAAAHEDYCQRFKNELLAENTRFHLRRLIFTPQLPAFLHSLIHNYYVLKQHIPNKIPLVEETTTTPEAVVEGINTSGNFLVDKTTIPSEEYLIQFTATYFLTTAIRQRTLLLPLSTHSLELQASFFHILHTQLAQSKSGCEWLIRVFTDKDIINEIICCPSERARDYVAALIEQAIKCTDQLLSAKDCVIEVKSKRIPENSTAQLINCLLSCIGTINTGAIIDVLWRIVKSNQDIAQYLADRAIIQRIISYLFERHNKKNNFNANNYKKNDVEPYLKFISPNPPPIGHPSADQDTPKAFDLFMKKDKFLVQPPANLTSLFQLLSHLILRSTIPLDHPLTIPSTLHHSLSHEEIELIISDPESVCQFMYTAMDKGQIYHMSKILAYLSYEDFDLSQNICIAAASVVNDKQCQEFCYAFVPLGQLCQIEDSLADKRIECALSRLIPSVEANLKYQKETDVCLQFILKIAYKSPRAAYQLQQNHQDFLDGLIKATTDFIPTKKEAEENCEKGVRNELQYYNIKLPRTLKELNSLRLWKLSQLEKLKAGECIECIDKEEFDSDAVMNESDYTTGMLLDYLQHIDSFLFDDTLVKWSCVRVQQVDVIKRIVSVYELVEEAVTFTPINHQQEEPLPAENTQLMQKTISKMEEEKMQLVNSNEYKVHNLPIGSVQLYPYKQMSDNHSIPLHQFQLLPEVSSEHSQQQQDQSGQQQQWTIHDGNLLNQSDEEEKDPSNIEENMVDDGTGDQNYENNQGSYPHFEDFEETNQEEEEEEEEQEEDDEQEEQEQEDEGDGNQEGEVEDNVASNSQQDSSTH